MKVSLSSLRAHLDFDATAAQVADRLTGIGLEVEGIEDKAAVLAPFRIAAVLAAVPHPNADRLRACTVDAGDGPVSVVCGAPNARAGMKGVFAPPGSHVPGTGITLKVAEVRGVQSAGMLLSFREMGLGDDHDGIVDLPADAPVGTPYAAWAGLDDPVIEIGVTPNRGDALCVRGIARDLAAGGLGTLRPLDRLWDPAPLPGTFPSPVRWELAMPDACSWVLGRTVRGVRNGVSPDWLRRRLDAVGMRPISALVDVTNFFTHEYGRPLHVFDADKVRGGVLRLRPGAGEAFRALNGKEYAVTPEDCVIADEAGVQSLAGVVGGEATGSGDTTTSVFIECALFDPVRVALTGRRHAVVSDARQRFERGVDPHLPPAALDAATRLILELCGGEASEVVQAGAEPRWQRSATMRFDRVAALGGVAVPPDEAVESLQRLGFRVEARDAERVTVAVPPWRNDVAMAAVGDGGYGLGNARLDQAASLPPDRARIAAEGCAAVEPECDLIEEVLRLRGLDTVPPASLPPLAAVPAATLTPRQVRAALARRTLAARGMLECVTFSFTARDRAALFGDAPGDVPDALRLSNPIASDLDQMRPTPVATLAQAAARNHARGIPDAALFEVGPAFRADEAGTGQEVVAAGLRPGATPRHPAAPSRPAGWMDAKADAMAALQALGLPMDSLSASPGSIGDAPGFYHPGRSGVVRQGPKLVLARFGALHPRVLAALDLPGPVAAFEVFLDRVPDPKRRRRQAPDLPAFQPLRRDFAFLVDAATPADAVLRAARGAERALIAGASVFDVFTGPGLPEGRKSVGVEVVFQPRDRTLTDAEIEAAGAKVVAAVAKATGGALR